MNRKKFAFSAASLLAVYLFFGASLTSKAITLDAADFNQPAAQCQSPETQATVENNIFLLTSNNFFADAVSSRASLTFQGCWSYFPTGGCRAIYNDSNNNFFICGACDRSGNPGGGRCNRITQQTLRTGYWCS